MSGRILLFGDQWAIAVGDGESGYYVMGFASKDAAREALNELARKG